MNILEAILPQLHKIIHRINANQPTQNTLRIRLKSVPKADEDQIISITILGPAYHPYLVISERNIILYGYKGRRGSEVGLDVKMLSWTEPDILQQIEHIINTQIRGE